MQTQDAQEHSINYNYVYQVIILFLDLRKEYIFYIYCKHLPYTGKYEEYSANNPKSHHS